MQRVLLMAVAICISAIASSAAEPVNPLRAVRHFMYQLDGLEDDGAVEALAASGYDLLIVDPVGTVAGSEDFDAKAMVARLHQGKPGRVVLAYVCIGEAEAYRSYWGKAWRKPAAGRAGEPDFLLAADPDGWAENFPVAYWDPRWRAIWLDDGRVIDKLMAAGFDGLFLDWVAGFEDERVIARAGRDQIDQTRAMAEFIVALRDRARRGNPNAVIVAQNPGELIEQWNDLTKPLPATMSETLAGVAFEDTWFAGVADEPWESGKAGDVPNRGKGDDSPAGLVRFYKRYADAGCVVFTIDYCVKPRNATGVYKASKKAGFFPLVTRVPLSRLTETPPPGLDESRHPSE